MTTPFPQRVKDLLQFVPEYEDDYNTPRKPQRDGDPGGREFDTEKYDNKENTQCNQNRRQKLGENAKSCALPMFPKRRSELFLLDSDTEDDETRTGNLNCAILSDSFMESPIVDHTNMSSHNESVGAYKTQPKDNLSFLARFDSLALNSSGNGQADKSTKTAGHTLNTIAETDEIDNGKTDQRIIETPLIQKSNASVITNRTAHNDTLFATPDVFKFSVTRRNRCSTQSQKMRANEVAQLRPQKVLFQTPMTCARAVPPNDSITMSLCDTMNESVNATNTTESSPLLAATAGSQIQIKTKKSLEAEFIGSEKEVPKKPTEQPSTMMATKPSATQSSTTKAAGTASTTSSSMLQLKNIEYSIIKKLGCGGSSSVYLARRKDNGQECALKVVDLRGDPAVIEGYLNETKLLAKLQGNVCVVSLYEYQLNQKESKLYMVMEKGDSDLNKILQNYKTNLPLYVLMNYLYQMLQAVNYIHQNGVIHSDLKPANFLMVNGRLKLIDFGIASNIAIDSTSIIKFSQAGTFNYISPEALTDTSTGSSPMRSNQPKIKISTKSDVWSLGCILYLFLYQKTPFNHIKNIYQKISAISSPKTAIDYPALPFYYPTMLVHMAKNCLQHNPKQRPSCADLLKYPFEMVIPIQNLSVPANVPLQP